MAVCLSFGEAAAEGLEAELLVKVAEVAHPFPPLILPLVFLGEDGFGEQPFGPFGERRQLLAGVTGDVAVPVVAEGGQHVGHVVFAGVAQQPLELMVLPALPLVLQDDRPVADGAQPDVAVVGEEMLRGVVRDVGGMVQRGQEQGAFAVLLLDLLGRLLQLLLKGGVAVVQEGGVVLHQDAVDAALRMVVVAGMHMDALLLEGRVPLHVVLVQVDVQIAEFAVAGLRVEPADAETFENHAGDVARSEDVQQGLQRLLLLSVPLFDGGHIGGPGHLQLLVRLLVGRQVLDAVQAQGKHPVQFCATVQFFIFFCRKGFR